MLAPSLAARRAIASPIPRDAPVMNKVIPRKERCCMGGCGSSVLYTAAQPAVAEGAIWFEIRCKRLLFIIAPLYTRHQNLLPSKSPRTFEFDCGKCMRLRLLPPLPHAQPLYFHIINTEFQYCWVFKSRNVCSQGKAHPHPPLSAGGGRKDGSAAQAGSNAKDMPCC